jgi:hypothetical protein
VIRKLKPASGLSWLGGAAALAAGLLSTHVASAEVTIAKGETWDAYVAGRASAFFSYATGDS